MRRAAGLVFLFALAACRRDTPRPTRAVPVDASIGPPPAAAVFEDAGDPGRLSLPGGTVIDLRPVGPSLVTVSIVESKTPTWKTLVLERQVPDAALVQVETFERGKKGYRPYDGRSRHVAEPGTTYAYRARIDAGAWTAPVNVRTADPKLAPPAPHDVRAFTDDRYSIEIAWDADTRAVNGFYLEARGDGEWFPAAVIAVEARRFAHGHLLPKTARQYRIAAFNQHGLSPFVQSERVTTAATKLGSLDKPRRPSPCTKVPPEKDPAVIDLSRAELTVSGGPRLISDPLGGGMRQLFGEYQGCMRDLGTFQLQGDVFTVLEPRDEGFPLLRGLRGAGTYAGESLGLYAFDHGRYVEANIASYCGDPYPDGMLDPTNPTFGRTGKGSDLAAWRGPFDSCQLDLPR